MQSNPDISTGLYHGLEAWQIRTPSATAVISVFGGQLLSFIPEGQPDLLWLSPKRAGLPTPAAADLPDRSPEELGERLLGVVTAAALRLVPAVAAQIELTFLGGRGRLDVPCETLLRYDD